MPDYNHKAVRTLAEHAKLKSLWLYDPTYKRWYSPTDFMKAFGNSNQDLSQYLITIELRDPIEAIKQGHKAIQELQHKIHALTVRVFEYHKHPS